MQNITTKSSIEIIATSSVVWEALITPDLIKKYFFDSDTISDWKVGSPIKFQGQYEGNQYEDKGTILELNPYKVFRYNYWSPLTGIDDKPENYFPVTYSLMETKGVTTLTVTQENIPDDKMRDQAETNWKKILDKLKNLIEDQLVITH